MWKRVSQAAGLLTGSVLTGSGVDQVGALTGSGQNSGRPLTGSGQNLGRVKKSVSGSDRVRDDVSIRFDRVENESGQR